MKTEKMMTAALSVLAYYDALNQTGNRAHHRGLTVELEGAIDRLRAAAHRRCETCAYFRPPCLDNGRRISGWCGKEAHSPPRDLDDTCKRWKERA